MQISETSESRGKLKAFRECGVCGDLAKSLHFGGVSCDSCKAFFRRTVQSKAYLSLRCNYKQQCTINMTTRKGCQSCRFQKCLSIGMEKKWVMNEEERQALHQHRKVRLEAKDGHKDAPRLGLPQNNPYHPKEEELLTYISVAEKELIEYMVRKYREAYRLIPYKHEQTGERSSLDIIDMFATILRRFVHYFQQMDDFRSLCPADQDLLLKSSVLEMCLIRSALHYDGDQNRWPKPGSEEMLPNLPIVRVQEAGKMLSPGLYQMQVQFMESMQRLEPDEVSVTILCFIILFCPDRLGLQDVDRITFLQDKYSFLLKHYMDWRFGPKSHSVYPKMIAKLSDLRQLNDMHTSHNLKLDESELRLIQTQLSQISLGAGKPGEQKVEESKTDSPDSRMGHEKLPCPMEVPDTKLLEPMSLHACPNNPTTAPAQAWAWTARVDQWPDEEASISPEGPNQLMAKLAIVPPNNHFLAAAVTKSGFGDSSYLIKQEKLSQEDDLYFQSPGGGKVAVQSLQQRAMNDAKAEFSECYQEV